MVTITAFTDPWYAEKIASLNVQSESAIAILYGAAFIAQAIDNSFSEPKTGQRENFVEGIMDAMNRIGSALEDVSAAIASLETGGADDD